MKSEFDPMRNKFPQMQCRVCDTWNPLVFLAPKPRTGRPGDTWICVCFDCADNRLGWINRATGDLKPGYSV